jgi:hypothetical protein
VENWKLWRVGFGILGLLIAWGMYSMRKDHTSDEYRKVAHEMTRHIEGYKDKPDYYDWLVDAAHDEVFSSAFHSEMHGRRRIETWVDDDQYFHELLMAMQRKAGEDHAAHVAEVINKFMQEQEAPVEAPKVLAPAAKKRK